MIKLEMVVLANSLQKALKDKEDALKTQRTLKNGNKRDHNPFDMLGPMPEEKPAFVMEEEKAIYVREWVEFWRQMQEEGDRNNNDNVIQTD